eukprot:scaffold1121_cov143-Skeletonema_menzelii.AAC.3
MERRRKNKKSVRGEVQKMMEVDAIRKTTNVQRSNNQQHFNLQWVQYLSASDDTTVRKTIEHCSWPERIHQSFNDPTPAGGQRAAAAANECKVDQVQVNTQQAKLSRSQLN